MMGTVGTFTKMGMSQGVDPCQGHVRSWALGGGVFGQRCVLVKNTNMLLIVKGRGEMEQIR